jgi:hypothetical protein
MANFVKISKGLVTESITADNAFFETFIDSTPGEWVEASAAGIGYVYDYVSGDFIPPKPHISWGLSVLNKWEAPVAYPADGSEYEWNEDTLAWDEVVEPT